MTSRPRLGCPGTSLLLLLRRGPEAWRRLFIRSRQQWKEPRMKADPSVARLHFDRFELDEAEARLTCAGQTRSARAEALRRALRTGAHLRQPGDEERVARPRLGSSLRLGVGAQDGHQRSACGARRRPETATLHRDRIAARLSLHRCHGGRVRRNARLPSSGTSRLGATTPPWRHSRHCAAATRRSPRSSTRSPPRWSASGSSSTIPRAESLP